ncbi:hypothetical protein CALCODRAFT_220894 [Calocera cornea HHB12733]|uniref:P-loop containing nucleoside triphosphate hydrolase protein n=1 Tax=Calocera cornea HHB12733 TaxID=1353952 RepID=A0A165C1M5_9BASI|nr:hypothetical protein CALCODRAFT_220894 [Calocera cornea HHB12733]
MENIDVHLSQTGMVDRPDQRDWDEMLERPDVIALSRKPKITKHWTPLLPRIEQKFTGHGDLTPPSAVTLERSYEVAQTRCTQLGIQASIGGSAKNHWIRMHAGASAEIRMFSQSQGIPLPLPRRRDATVSATDPEGSYEEYDYADVHSNRRDITQQCDLAMRKLGVSDPEVNFKGMTCALRPHQYEALAFMERMEVCTPHQGGIIGDEMGVGKTVTMIAWMSLRKGDRRPGEPGTLIVAPAGLLDQWATEIRKKTAGNLTALVWHGKVKTTFGPSKLKEYDVVLASYDEVSISWAKKKDRPLFDLLWQRIVLDEAQAISKYTSRRTRAVLSLDSYYKWCLSGTPVQNTPEDGYPLFQFLGVAFYRNRIFFDAHITRFIKTDPTRSIENLRLGLRMVMLRRKKDDTYNGEDIVPLPERRDHFAILPFRPDTQARYDSMALGAKRAMELHQSKGSVNMRWVRHTVFKLRRFAVHPALCDNFPRLNEDGDLEQILKQWTEAERGGARDYLAVHKALTCKCALLNEDDVYITPCQHTLCTRCLNMALEGDMHACPGSQCTRARGYCLALPIWFLPEEDEDDDEKLKLKDGRRDLASLPHVKKALASGLWTEKFLYIRNDIRRSLKADKGSHFIIASQWTMALDICQYAMDQEPGIRTARYQGGMSQGELKRVVLEFNSNPKNGPNVLFLSIAAGGVGLNLCGANRFYLLEPHYNPSREQQAAGRVHRWGQKKEVHIHYCRMAGTVEEGMITIQRRKVRGSSCGRA